MRNLVAIILIAAAAAGIYFFTRKKEEPSGLPGNVGIWKKPTTLTAAKGRDLPIAPSGETPLVTVQGEFVSGLGNGALNALADTVQNSGAAAQLRMVEAGRVAAIQNNSYVFIHDSIGNARAALGLG